MKQWHFAYRHHHFNAVAAHKIYFILSYINIYSEYNSVCALNCFFSTTAYEPGLQDFKIIDSILVKLSFLQVVQGDIIYCFLQVIS